MVEAGWTSPAPVTRSRTTERSATAAGGSTPSQAPSSAPGTAPTETRNSRSATASRACGTCPCPASSASPRRTRFALRRALRRRASCDETAGEHLDDGALGLGHGLVAVWKRPEHPAGENLLEGAV